MRRPTALVPGRLRRAPWRGPQSSGGADVLTFPDFAHAVKGGTAATYDLSAAIPATAADGDRVLVMVSTGGGSSTPDVDIGPSWDPLATLSRVTNASREYYASEAAQAALISGPWSLIQSNATSGSGVEGFATGAAVKGTKGTPTVAARNLTQTWQAWTTSADVLFDVPSPGPTLNPNSVALCFVNIWGSYGGTISAPGWSLVYYAGISGAVTLGEVAVLGILLPSVQTVPACPVTWSGFTNASRYPLGSAWAVALG